ncbi:hypothetical protein FHS89_001213 [Rubricella aquisinus]|uniref:Uncharacterized protein n=1 Tax=Rubricella aquisinus TaxID=2028108 RepID=A0A840WM53_9RHOB|nr:hypothetical protein [Rubricella aquisinus]MBB5515203.1 hypothetical protein [Rubricella aquisinus]
MAAEPSSPPVDSATDPRSLAPRGRRRRYDAALLLPLIGAVAMMPPFANLFTGGQGLFGIPSSVLYLFGAWALLILFARLLSRKLMATPPPPSSR